MSLDLMVMGKYVDDSSSSSSSSDSDSDDLSSSNSSSSSSSSSPSSSAASSPVSSPAVTARKKKAAAAPAAATKPRAKPNAKPRPRAVAAAPIESGNAPPPPPSSYPTTEKPKKKRVSPVKRATPAATARQKKPRVEELPPPPPPPSSPPPSTPSPPPPPPPPPLDRSDDNDSSSSSSGDSSDSSSSSDSDDFEVKPPLPPPSKAGMSKRASPSSRSKAVLGQSGESPVEADALKVKLKLPPGFIAKHPDGAALKTTLSERGKLKVQVTNSRPPAKKQKTTTPNGTSRKKATPTAGSKSRTPTKAMGVSRRANKAASTDEITSAPIGTSSMAIPHAPPPPVEPILKKLIPTGPTVPVGEIRCRRELKFIDEALSETRPYEISESELSKEFNDPFAVESDALRNLDLFFFCDEHGNAISLEVLDKPKHERPRIMGFGTVVEHLPPHERPIPVKYILPSPAFPSRSRKRRRSESGAALSPPSTKTTKPRPSTSSKKVLKSRAPSASAPPQIPQVDGLADDTSPLFSRLETPSIFGYSVVSTYRSRGNQRDTISQLDGQSDSDSSTSVTRSSRSSSGSGNDSDRGGSDNGYGSSSASSSESDSDSDVSGLLALRSMSSVGVNSEPAVESSPAPSDVTPTKRPPASRKTVKKNGNSSSPAMVIGVNPDVEELMRTDREGIIDLKGTDDELNLLECGFRHPQEYKRTRVWLPEVTDWCLDYSEGDPTLWVITPHAWYKIAGPLAGMLPHPSYRSKFKHVRTLFEASYLVAYVLKEWLPINKKVSYRSTLQQIVELSLKGRYPVSGWFLMENCQFIQNQICDLVADKEAYLDSMFFKQLQRMHDAHKAREKRVKKELADREEKRARREDERQRKRQQQEEERRKLLDKKEEERKQKEAERRYPIDDIELLTEEGGSTMNILPVAPAKWLGLDGFLLGDLIVAWQTIGTFKTFVSLEPIALDDLVAAVKSQEQGETNISLIRIFMAFLKVILSEKSFVSPMDDLVVEGSTTVADLFLNAERTYGICERPYLELLNALTWQDILRQLMAKDLGIDASIGYIEPLVGCEIVRQTLYMQNNSVPFNSPVDITIKGLEDYAHIIKHPMDLGTIKQKMDSGSYEGEDGHERFAADVRLIWDNAVLYNGEESEVGRAALALSDIFEQDYHRLVVGRIAANKAKLEASTAMVTHLKSDEVASTRSSFADIVHALYSTEFHQLPVAYKIGAVSWVCSEFLKLDSVRSHIEGQAEREFEANREFRKKFGELDARRKQSEKNRRERELAFRQECIDQGIEPNSNNHFSDAVKQEHPHIAEFYEELQAEKAAEEIEWQGDRKTLEDERQMALNGVIVRESPLGRDRFHNCYWLFKNDTPGRLFIEKSDSGEFMVVTNTTEIDTLLKWFNPKGVREFDLLSKLSKAREDFSCNADETTESPASSFWNIDHTLSVDLFPLPGEATRAKDRLTLSARDHTRNVEVLRQMLLRMFEYLHTSSITPADWDKSVLWTSRVQKSQSSVEFRGLFAELETTIINSRGGEDMIRTSWKRKRREWRLSLEAAATVSQIVFLLHLFLAECINVEAFVDLSVRLDRKEWLKLRPKECRNFIPEVGKVVVYFGDGHAQALKEDAKAKKKRFTRKSDSPILRKTLLCSVQDVSYYHGGGDPYALLVLRREDNIASHVTAREPGSMLCPRPSPLQRLSRILTRIVVKLKLHPDAGPFLEPVSDRDFPEYKEIVLHPIDLSKITAKARANEYKSAEKFMSDIRLMASNCELFCEGRFPALPPLARNIVDMAESHIRKSQKELRLYEKALNDGTEEVRIGSVSGGDKPVQQENGHKSHDALKTELVVIIRLENRLSEYLVDVKRYEAAVAHTWQCGEHFRMLFRDPRGFPGEYYGGVAAGSLPYDANGLLPWEALRVVWDEDDGSDDNRINPWEAELEHESRKNR